MAASPPRGAGVRFARAEGLSFQLFDQSVTAVTDVCSVRLYNPNPDYGSRLGWEVEMSERRITQLFGLVLGAIVSGTMVLNAFAF
jgi:hypothetical protein